MNLFENEMEEMMATPEGVFRSDILREFYGTVAMIKNFGIDLLTNSLKKRIKNGGSKKEIKQELSSINKIYNMMLNKTDRLTIDDIKEALK